MLVLTTESEPGQEDAGKAGRRDRLVGEAVQSRKAARNDRARLIGPSQGEPMSIDLEMEEILNLFFEESFEGLDVMESSLLTLKDDADRETINDHISSRAFHQGRRRNLWFHGNIRIHTFRGDLLDEMRNGMRGITPDAMQVLLQSVDGMREMARPRRRNSRSDGRRECALAESSRSMLAQKTPSAAAGAPEQPAARLPPRGRRPPPSRRRLRASFRALGARRRRTRRQVPWRAGASNSRLT